MIAPLKVSQNHIAASFLTASMQLSAATGVNRRSLLCLSGNGMWLHGAGNNDLLRRTSGCCETHLLFWHSGRSAGIPNTLLTYAMTYASDEDIETLKKYFSDDEFKAALDDPAPGIFDQRDRKSTRLNSSH